METISNSHFFLQFIVITKSHRLFRLKYNPKNITLVLYSGMTNSMMEQEMTLSLKEGNNILYHLHLPLASSCYVANFINIIIMMEIFFFKMTLQHQRQRRTFPGGGHFPLGTGGKSGNHYYYRVLVGFSHVG